MKTFLLSVALVVPLGSMSNEQLIVHWKNTAFSQVAAYKPPAPVRFVSYSGVFYEKRF